METGTTMIISKQTLNQNNASRKIETPTSTYFNLPEKVLQFGTGVLLRGLPDYFIDKANKQGVFNGRIVVVKSTDSNGADAFDTQNGLYTHVIRGIDKGVQVDEVVLNASISRVVSAKKDWNAILEVAKNPELSLIISNTTEVGITLDTTDSIHNTPPSSFPGKLLAVLYHRFKTFGNDSSKGLVIVPTELIPNNGDKLASIIVELAHLNKLEFEFLDWLEQHNHFCNSLVDRIVPGKLPADKYQSLVQEIGYDDELAIMSEVYSLWAIQANHPKVAEVLSFSSIDNGVVVAPDIERFRELKLRLLNGSHTFTCGMAHLLGFETVVQAMNNPHFFEFISELMREEIARSLTVENISLDAALDFADAVLDRYKNPFIEHKWLSITMQYSSKMTMRNVPLILKYVERFNKVPQKMAFGFAAYLSFMQVSLGENGKYQGTRNGKTYEVNDDKSPILAEAWAAHQGQDLVRAVSSNQNLWGTDLTQIPGWVETVAAFLDKVQSLQFSIQTIREASLV
jgi:tagaturonate reductase